jgi:hypothetical protein
MENSDWRWDRLTVILYLGKTKLSKFFNNYSASVLTVFQITYISKSVQC